MTVYLEYVWLREFFLGKQLNDIVGHHNRNIKPLGKMAQERLGLDDKQWLNFKKIKWAKGVFTSKLIVNGEAVLDGV